MHVLSCHLQSKSMVRFTRLSMSESGHLQTNTYVTVLSLAPYMHSRYSHHLLCSAISSRSRPRPCARQRCILSSEDIIVRSSLSVIFFDKIHHCPTENVLTRKNRTFRGHGRDIAQPNSADSWTPGWAPLTGASSAKPVVKACRNVRATIELARPVFHPDMHPQDHVPWLS